MRSQKHSILPLFSGGLDLNIPFNIPNLYRAIVAEFAYSNTGRYRNNIYDKNKISLNYMQTDKSGTVWLSIINGQYVAETIGSGGYPWIRLYNYLSLGDLINNYTFAIVYKHHISTGTLVDNCLLTTYNVNPSIPDLHSYGKELTELYRPAGLDILRIRLTDATTNQIIVDINETITNLNIIFMTYNDTTKVLNLYVNGVLYTSTNALMSGYYFDVTNSDVAAYANIWLSVINSLTGAYEKVWDGIMGDNLFYNRVLTNTEINKLGNFLAEKFGGNWTDI